MATKNCPSCGAEAPSSATRCKECFHDYSEKSATNHKAGLLFILATVAIFAVSGAGMFYWISQRPIEHRILVDAETRSVIFTTQYRSGPETERLRFDDVARLEHVIDGGSSEVVAVRTDGERRVIQSGQGSLAQMADEYSRMMEKPLTTVDKNKEF